MSRISIVVIACLGALLFFGLGYRVGFVPPPPDQYRPLAARDPSSALTPVAVEIRDALQIADPIERVVVLGTALRGRQIGY